MCDIQSRHDVDGNVFSCDVCNDLNENPLLGTLAKLEAAAIRGCSTCSFLRDSIVAVIPEAERRPEDAKLASSTKSRLSSAESTLEVSVTISDTTTDVHYFTLAGYPSPRRCIKSAFIPPGDTGSDASLETVQRWLKKCTETHSRCGANSRVPLPTRVLDVGLIGGERDVRVCLTRGEHGRYVCLSHCWGTLQPIVTTQSTLKIHTQGIPWKSLPQTFQDAITFVRMLRIQYIWIDSLCIIQDDEEDWMKEAAQMASIYRNGALTLAATASENAASGLFASMSPKFHAHELSLDDIHGQRCQVFVRQNMPHVDQLHLHYTRSYSGFPLLRRGWVFQERLLSPRVLHFTPHELMWECTETFSCECGYTGPTETDQDAPGHLKIDHSHTLARGSYEEILRQWRRIVSTYSMLDMTFERDKLPAFAGAAKQMQPYRKGRYLAGLWEDSLVVDLSWLALGKPKQRPVAWRAPTWSWASVGGPVMYDTRQVEDIVFEKCIQVLQVEYKPVNEESLTEVSSGCLLISGKIIKAAFVYAGGDEDDSEPPTCFLEVAGERRIAFHPDYPFYNAGDGHIAQGQEVSCLRILQKGVDRALCLGLKRLHQGSQMYERLGISPCDEYDMINVEKWFENVQETTLTII